jgi:hypothetical protein
MSIVDYTDRSTCIILEMVQVQYCLTNYEGWDYRMSI